LESTGKEKQLYKKIESIAIVYVLENQTSIDSMDTLSPINTENATKKRIRASHTRKETTCKIVAFDVLRSLKRRKRSERKIAALLEVPNSTMQSWRAAEAARRVPRELETFISTPAGAAFLQRVIMAAYQTIHFGCGGIRSLQEFLRLSQLSNFVASSEGALHAFSVRCEEYIVEFGEREERKLAEGMGKRKITAALDEMFRGKHPCLVAIEVVSNFILLERFTEDRKAETWTSALKPRLDDLNLELQQVVSDQGSGIRSCSEILGVRHVAELFHAQHELTKATSAPLSAQEREFEKSLSEAEEKLKKKIERYGADSNEAQGARATRNLKHHGLEMRKERRQKVREAKKELGRIYHPINMKTGKLQTVDEIKSGFDKQLNIIEVCANEAGLKSSCKKRLVKARRTFDSMISNLTCLFALYVALVGDLKCDESQECFFNEVVFPLCYLKTVWRRLQKKDRDKLVNLREELERKLTEASYSEEMKLSWMRRGSEIADLFQRSSSCVEGRNGMLSLYFHRFHRFNTRGLRALTVVHNFHTRRVDETTAAERLFGSNHQNLFESIVLNVRIPGLPRVQNHDPLKRQLWRKKRLAA
jgi:hypothetical protein